MKVGIIGASGYTGGELLRILAKHDACEIACATSRRYEGKKISRVHPNLKGVLDMEFSNLSPEEVASRSDFVFTATPHGVSMKAVPKILKEDTKVVDLSGDFRFSDTSRYEKYYGLKHEHPEIRAVYGLPELYKTDIKNANLVANPGCYPTTAILGLAPALKVGLIEADRIVVDSKSGISGAGASPGPASHFCTVHDGVMPYKVRGHRHLPEIEQGLSQFDSGVRISFVPHVVPVIRGMVTTIHTFLKKESMDVTGQDVWKIYSDFYKEEPFVRVWAPGEIPVMSASRGTNYLDIGCFETDIERNRLVIVAVHDNLIKGASGQAVQNMNLMAGFDETKGLENIGLHP